MKHCSIYSSNKRNIYIKRGRKKFFYTIIFIHKMSTTTTYDPTDDTINTVITGLLPLLLIGLYKGFENEKKKPFSPINIFDDIIIFASIIIFPFITGIQGYSHFSEVNKQSFVMMYILAIVVGLFGYIVFIWIYSINETMSGRIPTTSDLVIYFTLL